MFTVVPLLQEFISFSGSSWPNYSVTSKGEEMSTFEGNVSTWLVSTCRGASLLQGAYTVYSVSRETDENFYLGMKLLVKVCGLLLPLDEIQHFPERGGGRDEEKKRRRMRRGKKEVLGKKRGENEKGKEGKEGGWRENSRGKEKGRKR